MKKIEGQRYIISILYKLRLEVISLFLFNSYKQKGRAIRNKALFK